MASLRRVLELGATVLRRSGARGRATPELPHEPRVAGFFDSYPRFYLTSLTTGTPQRLNARYRALIEANQEIIQGARVLDLASHDGRWSFAALKAGARFVAGIEARAYLVRAAEATMHEYGVEEGSYSFVVGDVFEKIGSFAGAGFDTIFCLGFLYHTPHQMLLLSEIDRLKPHHLLLDTQIDMSKDPLIRLWQEEVALEANSVVATPADADRAIVGLPSRSAIEMMLRSFGWNFAYYDWQTAQGHRWQELEDYRDGRRITLMASRR